MPRGSKPGTQGYTNKHPRTGSFTAPRPDRIEAGRRVAIALRAGAHRGQRMPVPDRVFDMLVRDLAAAPDDVPAHQVERAAHYGKRGARRPITARQQEALQGLADGLQIKQLAARMGITWGGCKKLVEVARYNLNADTKEQAVAIAVQAGLVVANPLPLYPTPVGRTMNYGARRRRQERAGLTPEAAAVVPLLCDGFGNAEMALRLHVTEDVVKERLKDLYAALGAQNRTHAVALCMRQRLHR